MDNRPKRSGDFRAWMWNGKPVCRVAFREAIQLSNKKLTKFEKAISAGMLQPYEDQRQYNGSSERNLSKLLDVDAFSLLCTSI